MNPLVHIILVNWNGYDDTVECVESCLTLAHAPFEVVVVDNGSADGSGERLRTRFSAEPRVSVILTRENLGFAGGNNAGIARALDAGADYIWLLNNDTVVEPASLSALLAAAESHPDAGMFGSKVYYYDRPSVLWFAGGFIREVREGSTFHRGLEEEDTGQYDTPGTVDYVTGASLFASAALVREIGMMSEDYFLYWEEVDWCARAAAAGHPNRYVPASRVWHKVGASLGAQNSPVQIRYDARNRLLFYRRNRPNDLPRVLAWVTRQVVTLALLRGKPKHAAALLRGEIDFITGKRGRIDAG